MSENDFHYDDEVIIEAKPQAPKPKQRQNSNTNIIKLIAPVISVAAVIFALLAAFILVCGSVVGYRAMLGIAILLDIGCAGVSIAMIIKNQDAKPCKSLIWTAFAIFITILTFVI